MNDAEQFRAGLDALAAAEAASPSPVWEPVHEGADGTAGEDYDTVTLTLDGPLRDALVYLAHGTDGSLVETARKAILDAALHTRADDITFAHSIAAHTA
ncbi:hypothetical protein ACIQHU_39015 [Streptomyces tendae]|uniref:hypothetical protein n=1 Tax=Streptomyces tendae TaxID=1932 RepID=UPI0038114BFC